MTRHQHPPRSRRREFTLHGTPDHVAFRPLRGSALAAALLAIHIWACVPTAALAAPLTVEARTAASTDDAEERADASMYLTSTDLELIHDASDQTVGMRWIALAIPPGATITAAYIQFSAKEAQSEVTTLTLRGEAVDNPLTFGSAKLNISSRPRTTAATTWTPTAWLVGEVGANQRTPDLSAIIQEIVSRSGWASGNALAIIVTGTGHRTAYAWNGKPASAPLLHIEYTTGPVPEAPPVARLSVAQLASPALTARADGSTSTDVDATPIATYKFTFGDGSAAVTTNAPTATAQHTYASPGIYTVTLVCTDTGGNASAPVTATVNVTVDAPPAARLSVTQLASPALTVRADGSTSTDTDATGIATYKFTFGDGSAAVTTNAPTATAQHTYASSGSYTVTLVCTDTGGNPSAPATFLINVTGTDAPPVARLTVSQLASPALTVLADGSTSTDTDATAIATYKFTFGDGSAAVTTNAPTATAQHTYASSGSYTVTLVCTDTGGNASAPVTFSINVTTSSGGQVAVYTGYYDTHHAGAPKPKPNPWNGSPNTLFIGTPDKAGTNTWDCSVLRVDNLTSAPISGVVVTADIGSHHYALWGTNTIPAGYHLILAQTAFENFDGSDLNSAGCYSCNPNDCLTKVSSVIPLVKVTIGGTTTTYYDTGQQLNTNGVDLAGCPYTGARNDESENWEQVYNHLSPNFVVQQDASGEVMAVNSPARELWLATPFPNPSHGRLVFSFRTGSTGEVQLGVYDITGRLVRQSVDGIMEPGEYRDEVDLSGLASGAYFCRLTTREGTLHKTFMLVR